MAETIQRNIELIGMPEWTEKEQAFAKSLQKELGEKETGYPFKDKATERAIGYTGRMEVLRMSEKLLLSPTATLNFPGWGSGSNRPSLVDSSMQVMVRQHGKVLIQERK